MALSNRDRVERVMESIRLGLGPCVLREYKMVYTARGYLSEIEATLSSNAYAARIGSEVEAMESIDAQGWLKLMWARWNEVFAGKLGHSERSYISELMEARNAWAHQKAFSNDEAFRVADTAGRLLKSIGAAREAALAEEIGRDLLRIRFEEEAKKSRGTAPLPTGEVSTPAGLKPWREVISPHPDVASGNYITADFAADLSQVLAGQAPPEYQDPREFFQRTYFTEGLLTMLATGVKRLASLGGEPVIQLKTSFGGGKTHSMLALYHLSGGALRLADIPDGGRLAEEVGQIDLPQATRAVLVGTALNPASPSTYEGLVVNTLWGEIAYQLGGVEGYEMIRRNDETGVAPGANDLYALLYQYGPCLIIIDELVAYVRSMYGVDRLPAGTYESVMTFMQALTEAVKRTPDSMLLVSLPESEMEKGGQVGGIVLDALSHIVGRIESVWKPVTATESFEIVRRRLFSQQIDYAARDAVIDAFNRLYRESAGEFPSGVAEAAYKERMRAAYPIHPELFERLYQDWSTLDRFQRTRGVLRLMADIIRELWSRDDKSLLILPGTLPLDASRVRNEILRYRPDTWTAVFDKDIDGGESLPYQIDATVPFLGKYTAARRVARAIFVGSAPSVAAQSVRGLEEIRIRLACTQPGEQAAAFGDALRRMSNQLTYLYSDGSRYWYDTHPSINHIARDRVDWFTREENREYVNQEIIGRLKKVSRIRDFAGYHIASLDPGDVSDEDRVRVVVIHPDHAFKRGNGESQARAWARGCLNSRGAGQRLNKNMLIFLAADETQGENLKQAVREYLAWKSISDEEESLNLDAQQRRQVGEALARADQTIGERIKEAYCWLLVPVQSDFNAESLSFQEARLSGEGLYDRAARKLRQDGLVIDHWSPDILRMELDRFGLWNEDGELNLKMLWSYLSQYCYLPRLFDHEVLVKAVRDGVIRSDAPFGYATGRNEKGHMGLVFRGSGSIYFDEHSLLVHPDYVMEPELPVAPPPPPSDGEGPTVTGGRGGITTPPAPRPKTRYYGQVHIDPQRVNKDMGLIVEEIVERLTSLVGCEVTISVEITARLPEGFDEATIRTVNENSKTLKFDGFGFESE